MIGTSLLLLGQLITVGNLLSNLTIINPSIILTISIVHLITFALISSYIIVVFSYYQVLGIMGHIIACWSFQELTACVLKQLLGQASHHGHELH